MSLVGQELAERYRLVSVLGAGGMATVYRAHDRRLGRDVAIKVLAPNLAADPTTAARFEREARALAAVTHPAIVGVYDVGDDKGEPWFVMELVDGETLAARLAREGALPVAVAVPLLLTVAQGLAALHAAGLIHRDVKPGNVLITSGGSARVADFGLVRGDTSTLTEPGTAIGTLAYLAPELLAGEPATPAADVYALGAVAYEALTGRTPYPAGTVAGLVEAQTRPPVPPSSVAPWLGSGFDEPLLAALGPAVGRPDLARFAVELQRAAARVPAEGGAPGAAATDTDATRSLVSPTATAVSLWPILAGIVLGLVVLAALWALASGGRSGNPSDTGPSAVAVVPSPSPTPSPTSAADGIAGAIAALATAIDEAQGGPDGLRGNDARDLEKQLDEIVRHVGERDLDKARESADKLVERIEKLVDEDLDQTTGERLLSAAEALRDALAAVAGTLGAIRVG